MLEMVEARRTSSEVDDRHDLFSGLLDASREEHENMAALSNDELIGKDSVSRPFSLLKDILLAISGNMFIFILAGHDVSPPVILHVITLLMAKTTFRPPHIQ